MKYKIYTVHDCKAEAFMTPFFMQTDAQAARGFADAVNDPSTSIGKHPQDYTLFCVGEWSDHSGTLQIQDKQSIGNGVEFLHQLKTDEQVELNLE